MSGVEAGTLSQTFATTIGNTYNVSFQLSGNPAGDPAVKTLEVSATGGTVGLYSYDVTGNDLTNMNWMPEKYSFLATSASTTLSFVSTTAGAFGPAIDNVVVTEDVPEKDDCKQGGWETMIDNAGNSFKNQGDCVSYFATKGKNLGALPPLLQPAPAPRRRLTQRPRLSSSRASRTRRPLGPSDTTQRRRPRARPTVVMVRSRKRPNSLLTLQGQLAPSDQSKGPTISCGMEPIRSRWTGSAAGGLESPIATQRP